MAPVLLQTPAFLTPPAALEKSKLATRFLLTQSSWSLPLPGFLAKILQTESQEQWITYENLIVASLKTSDDDTARALLDRLTDRFGPDNERVQTLEGLYSEATAKDELALKQVLEHYDLLLEQNPINMSIRKRRVALLQSMGKTDKAVKALTELLDVSPTDIEAWAELAELYHSLGLHSQSIFCLEEVLLVAPNAWNVHAKLGEATMVLAAASTESHGEQTRLYAEAMRRFCRSVELCDDYLRGYYGLKLSTTRLLESITGDNKKPAKLSDAADGLPAPLLGSIQGLNELATSKLGEIIRRASTPDKGWDGYDQNELTAARALLDQSIVPIQR